MDMQITTANYETKYQQLINVERNALNVREPIDYLTVVADYITEVLFMQKKTQKQTRSLFK